MLRKVSFKYLSPVTDSDGNRTIPKNGDLMDLFQAADPYNFLPPQFPPLRVVNSFLKSGLNDLGMGGGAAWEPFEISKTEFDDLIEYLRSAEGNARFPRNEPLTIAEVPEDIQTVAEYSEWKIDECLKDPNHHLNSDERYMRLTDGRMVTFKEYWERTKSQKIRRG